nr:hypothetical protein HK105_003649 [Polyrhizophydium stewartii]
MVFNIAFTQQPIAQADFAAKWYPDTTIGPVGNYNYDVDLSNLPQAKDGVNATLQLMYNGGDGMLYQCTDIVLSSSLSTGGTKNAAVAAMLPAGAAAAAAALSALALIL